MKKGIEYENLVGEVMRALYPSDKIVVRSFVDGPDGRRDVDVGVTIDSGGVKSLLYVECKDWGRPVGIEVVDALESKTKDVKADGVIISSNSGFTRQALLKAGRLNITLVSSLKKGSDLIRIEVHKIAIAKKYSVDNFEITIYPIADDLKKIPASFSSDDITYRDLPIRNWIAPQSEKILESPDFVNNPRESAVCLATYAFRNVTRFEVKNNPVFLMGFSVKMNLSKCVLSQEITVNASLGLFDYAKQKVIVPNKQTYFESYDENKWEKMEMSEYTAKELSQSELAICISFGNPIRPLPDFGVPNLDDTISESEITLI